MLAFSPKTHASGDPAPNTQAFKTGLAPGGWLAAQQTGAANACGYKYCKWGITSYIKLCMNEGLESEPYSESAAVRQ